MTLFLVEIVEGDAEQIPRKVYAVASDTEEAKTNVLKANGTATVISIEFVADTTSKVNDYLFPLVTPGLVSKFHQEFCAEDNVRDGSSDMVGYYKGWDAGIEQFKRFLQRNLF